MKKNRTKHAIYLRTFSALLAVYLVLMAGFSILLIMQQKKAESLELRTFALYVNNTVQGILQDNIDHNNQITDLAKIKREFVRQSSLFNIPGTELAVFTGDHKLIFNTNDNWLCSYTEYRKGNRYYIGYGHLNPKDWFKEKEIKEIENYLYAKPKAEKIGDLAGYSLTLKGFWVDNEIIIPDQITVTGMYAQSFDENGNLNSSGGTQHNDIVYTSGYKNTKDLPYFAHGTIQPASNGYRNNAKQLDLRSIVLNKAKLKEAVKQAGDISCERVNPVTYRYYLPMPYQNTVTVMNNHNYSEFWTVFAREVNLLDKCIDVLAFVWASSLMVFITVAMILSKQTYKTYKRRAKLEKHRVETTNALAHDLKTPLSIISGYAQNLKENVHTDKREYYAGNIQTNVNRMDKIIQEMLELSRLESELLQIKFADVSLGEVCIKTINRYQQVCNEKHIVTSLEGDAIVKADHSLMERVIDNFFANALDNTPDGGTIRIKIFDNTLEFYNSGSHIPEEKLKEIWLPYRKANVSRSNTKGTGLGLAIARTILELYKFSYGAKNTDAGVVFWFKFV